MLKKNSLFGITVVLGDPSLADSVKLNNKFNEEDLTTVNIMKEALASIKDYSFTYLNRHHTLLDDLKTLKPSFIFNLCDEGFFNDPFKEPHIPSLLEVLDIPYSGSNSRTLSVCYNKLTVTSVARSLNIYTPNEYIIIDNSICDIHSSIYPALVKPKFGDNSVGITKTSVVFNKAELNSYLNEFSRILPNSDFIIQEYLTGSEYSVGIIGNSTNDFSILPILEVDYSALPTNLPPILGYESKMVPDSAYSQMISYKPAKLHPKLNDYLIKSSLRLKREFGCRDYSRYDFRMCKDKIPKLLEVNPNPGWCHDGKMNIMANWASIDYCSLLKLIINAALKRYSLT
jgi:D-alanine-D-alanine ligase